jgi:plasmid stabilization system protein ParE
MPPRVLLSARADRWLHSETAYIAQRSIAAARRFLDRIEGAAASLLRFARSGRPGLIAWTRCLIVALHVTTYRERGTDLEIIDVRHGRQAETVD